MRPQPARRTPSNPRIDGQCDECGDQDQRRPPCGATGEDTGNAAQVGDDGRDEPERLQVEADDAVIVALPPELE